MIDGRIERGLEMATECDGWFEAAPDDQRPVLNELRGIILSAAPGIVEELKWGQPWYSSRNGLFCYLQRRKDYVTLGFRMGTSLSDPKKLLEGTGKDMRHVKLTSLDARNKPALLDLIKQAIKLR